MISRPSPNCALVCCQGVTKDFGQGDERARVIHGIDLELYAGELTLLAGPSGCGKTTMLSMIAGLLDPTAGEITVTGLSLTALTANEKALLRRKCVGYVFQQYQLLPALSAVENAAVPLIVAGAPRRLALARAAELLEQLGMGHRLHALPAHLSYGQQQRVAIARAVIHEPCLLLCDEPTASLDAETGRGVMQLLQQIAVRPDRAVLVVTHDNRVFDFGERMIEMDDGRVVADRRGNQALAPLEVEQ